MVLLLLFASSYIFLTATCSGSYSWTIPRNEQRNKVKKEKKNHKNNIKKIKGANFDIKERS